MNFVTTVKFIEILPGSQLLKTYNKLSVIDNKLLNQIKRLFISAKNVLIVTNKDLVYGYGNVGWNVLGMDYMTTVITVPTIIPELCGKDIMKVSFQNHFTVALTGSNEIITWGCATNGGLGNGISDGHSYRPDKVNMANEKIIDFSCRGNGTYLLTDKQQVYCFGLIDGKVFSPTKVDGFANEKIISISCGLDHTLLLNQKGAVFTMGSNAYGQLGYTTNKIWNNIQTVPQLIQSSNITQISCGKYHSLLLDSDGLVLSFGRNDHGQLGTGQVFSLNQSTPNPIKANDKFIEILAFEDTSMAMNIDHDVLLWGRLKGNSSVIPISIGLSNFQDAINEYIAFPFTHQVIPFNTAAQDMPSNRVIKTMIKAFNNTENSDIMFKLKHRDSEEFESIYGHKWFLEVNLEHFRRMFAHNCSENNTNEIEINSYSYEAYYQFIKYLYTDFIDTQDVNQLMELLTISGEYLDEDLKSKCVAKVLPLINLKNVCLLYGCAISNKSSQLEEICYEFMAENFSYLCKTEEYDNLDDKVSKKFLTEYLSEFARK